MILFVVFVKDLHALFKKCMNAVGDVLRLAFNGRARFLIVPIVADSRRFVAVVLAEHDEFLRPREARAVAGLIVLARMQRGRVIIGELHRLFDHDLREDEVDGREHFGTAAEVLRKVDTRTRLWVLWIRFIFFVEELRVREAETVNALLDVADDEEIRRLLPRDEVHDGLLHAIRVLIFIDHDLVIFFAQRECDRRRRKRRVRVCRMRLVVDEDRKREMLEVAEIGEPFLFLCLLIRRMERNRQLHELAHIGRGMAQAVQQFVFRRIEILFLQLRERLLELVALRLERLRDRLVRATRRLELSELR